MFAEQGVAGAAVGERALHRSGRGKARVWLEEEKDVRYRAEAGGGWAMLGTMVLLVVLVSALVLSVPVRPEPLAGCLA